MPALVLAQDQHHDPMPVVLVPPKLPAECPGDEIRDTEREPVNVHVSGRAALLIFPEAGPERRQVLIGPAPVLVQGCRLMRNKPEAPNAGSGKARLALPVGLLTLQLNLGLQGNGPGLARAAAQHVSAPILTVGCPAGLLGQSVPARRAGSDQALRLEIEMQIAFSPSFRSMPGRVSKEPGAQAGDFGDRSPSALGHPRIALCRGSELLPLGVTHERREPEVLPIAYRRAGAWLFIAPTDGAAAQSLQRYQHQSELS